MTSQLRIISVNAKFPERQKIEEAASILRSGGLVAFPTETVYGLGADSTNISAMKRLDIVKGRPANKPYSLLVYSCQQVEAKVANISLTLYFEFKSSFTIFGPSAINKLFSSRYFF